VIITRKTTNKRENDFYRRLALFSFPPASSRKGEKRGVYGMKEMKEIGEWRKDLREEKEI